MTSADLPHILLLTVMISLAAWTITEDLLRMEIAAYPVLGLSALMVFHGILFPIPPLSPDHALAGAALGLGLGTLTRALVHWRSGAPAFGGADIALLAGAGGMLGPFLFGPWLFFAAATAVLMSVAAAPLGLRKTDIDGTEVVALPFCPALLVTAGLTYAIALAGTMSGKGFS